MTASLETLVIAAYVFATTFRIPRPGPIGKVSDEEMVALAVAQAITGAVSDRRFLGTIDRLLPGFFPDLPEPPFQVGGFSLFLTSTSSSSCLIFSQDLSIFCGAPSIQRF